MANYTKKVGDVVEYCAARFADEGVSNWYTNMYLYWLNNYITQERFYEDEILEKLQTDDATTNHHIYMAFKALMGLFYNVAHVQPHLSYGRVGEICIKILKGEV